MYIAHVDNPKDNPLTFHLIIPSGSKIPCVGDRVFASADNGRHGEYRVISQVIGITRFSRSLQIRMTGSDFLVSPFVSVDYLSVK